MTQIQDYNWVTNALNFWMNTTPKECGKSKKIINWNIKMLTEARERMEALTMQTYTVKILKNAKHVDTQKVKARDQWQARTLAMIQTKAPFNGESVEYEVK